jgi:opacity protein-like surface antigen
MKKLIFLTATVLLMACVQPASAQIPAQPDPIATQATWWAKMFGGLKASYNITLVVSSFQNVYEINNVTALQAEGQFLILRQKGKDNRDYRVIVHASNVLMIREGEGQDKP